MILQYGINFNAKLALSLKVDFRQNLDKKKQRHKEKMFVAFTMFMMDFRSNFVL